MIVVDLGCCPHEGDLSIAPLIERFQPRVLFGFDPLLLNARSYELGETLVVLKPEAAWLYDGVIDLGVGAGSDLDATVVREMSDRWEWEETTQVACFDFVEWLRFLDPKEKRILKMNVEGAEFALLNRLFESGYDETFDRIIVAWHDDRMGEEFTRQRQRLERSLRCQVEEWEPACV